MTSTAIGANRSSLCAVRTNGKAADGQKEDYEGRRRGGDPAGTRTQLLEGPDPQRRRLPGRGRLPEPRRCRPRGSRTLRTRARAREPRGRRPEGSDPDRRHPVLRASGAQTSAKPSCDPRTRISSGTRPTTTASAGRRASTPRIMAPGRPSPSDHRENNVACFATLPGSGDSYKPPKSFPLAGYPHCSAATLL